MRPGPWSWLLVWIALTPLGCSGPFIRSQSPEIELEEATRVKVVGDYAVAYGMFPVKVENVALVTNLPGTGSDPEPSPSRDQLLNEMKTHGVENPSRLLASRNTSLVLVRGFLRPGIQEGDHFDIEVRVPARSETSSLRGGWLMQTRMTEMAVLGGSVREGSLLALAQGPLLVDPSATKDSRVSANRARVLGGGVALKSRPMALVLKPDHRSVAISAHVGTAINRRFHTFKSGAKVGVANPKDDQHVDLLVHPRYKDNIERYMQVVRAIPMHESAAQLSSRLLMLERQLLDPITSSPAALRLEAIGKLGIPVLEKGLKSPDPEVRFYSSEALAYLDQAESATPLAESARDVPAFRAYALAALSALNNYQSTEALRALLDLPSNETRYGAFRAMWAMSSRDPLVRGEVLGEQFSLHVIDSLGPPLVHVTRSYRPEVVLFGQDQRLTTPVVLDAGQDIMLTGKDDRVTISRFKSNEPDQKRVVSNRIDECIRTIVELGGTYPDVVQALQTAKAKGVLAGRFAIDAVPSGGRHYDRGTFVASSKGIEPANAAAAENGDATEDSTGTSGDTDRDTSQEEDTTGLAAGVVVANPLPGLFDNGQKTLDKQRDSDIHPTTPEEEDEPKQPRSMATGIAAGIRERLRDDDESKKPRPKRSWLGTMK